MMVAWLWLGVMTLGIGFWVWRDAKRFPAFAALTDTAARQRQYRRWIIESFAIFSGAAAITLALLGAGYPFAIPAAFATLRESAGDFAPSASILLGLAGGMTVTLLIAGVAAWRAARRGEAHHIVVPGAADSDVQAMFPRNARELFWMVPLSINAGFSEELFFRLALPLLLAHLTGSAWIAFAVATIAFGLAHVYQGWVGVFSTAFVGALLAACYLATGSLLVVIALHAGIDLFALVLRPAIAMGAARLGRSAAAGRRA